MTKNRFFISLILILFIINMALAHPHGFDVAKKSLQANYGKHGITAGQGHFKDVWARDAFFASLGANRIGDHNISKITLETFIKHQKENGQIPLRVGDRFIALKFIGIHTGGEVPKFDNDKTSPPALDPNCLFIIASKDYIEAYGDWFFAKENYESFTKAIKWLERRDTDNNMLIEEHYGNWADSIRKHGEVLYTNVCYYKALKDMSTITKVLADTEQSSEQKKRYEKQEIKYKEKAEKVKKAIQKLYNGKYFIDGNEHDGNTREWFSTDGNVLAILWGVANQTQAKSIIDYAKKNKLEEHFSIKLNYPQIPSKKKSLFIRMLGISDYHDGMLWPWLGALYCIAKEKTYPGEGEPCLDKISKVYDEQGVVKEVYETNGKPVRRILYRSERDFAWGAGLFIYAHEEWIS